MFNLLVAHTHLESFVRHYGKYPEYVTDGEARTNGWVCATGGITYEYVTLGDRNPPVLIDRNRHRGGFIVVYGNDKVAVIPAKDFDEFCTALKHGQLSIRPSWRENGENLRWGPQRLFGVIPKAIWSPFKRLFGVR